MKRAKITILPSLIAGSGTFLIQSDGVVTAASPTPIQFQYPAFGNVIKVVPGKELKLVPEDKTVQNVGGTVAVDQSQNSAAESPPSANLLCPPVAVQECNPIYGMPVKSGNVLFINETGMTPKLPIFYVNANLPPSTVLNNAELNNGVMNILKGVHRNDSQKNNKKKSSTHKLSNSKIKPKAAPLLMPIPLAPKNSSNVSCQPDVSNKNGTKEKGRRAVYVLQREDHFENNHKVNGEKVQTPSETASKAIKQPESKTKVLYDKGKKTKIIYRVVNPEDLNLCPQTDKKEASFIQTSTSQKKVIIKKNSKSKIQIDANSTEVISVTRSGRSVRPPRHATTATDKNVDESVQTDLMTKNLFDKSAKMTDNLSLRCRLTCPYCKKVYRGIKRMGRHFHTFPEHAINSKCKELLKNYKKEFGEIKKRQTADANTQTDFPSVENSESIPSIKNLLCDVKKNIDVEVTFNKYRETSDRSLFRSLIRILQRATPESRASVFLRQLALLTAKLRKLLPCLLHRSNNSTSCLINEFVSKILDIAPGKYRLNMDAIACTKLPHGMCLHMQSNESAAIQTEALAAIDTAWPANGDDKFIEDEKPLKECARTHSIDKWTSDIGKRKWIPIGLNNPPDESSTSDQNSWISTCDVLVNNAQFVHGEKQSKSWESNLHKTNISCENSKSNSWISETISDLSKMDIERELNTQSQILNAPQNDILSNPLRSSTSSTALPYKCKDKLVAVHSNLVFDMNKEMIPLSIKNNMPCTNQETCMSESNEAENFDFNTSQFDMEIEKLNFPDSNKLNFSSAQYNEMKYGRDTLPPFRKIDTSKSHQLPVDPMGDGSEKLGDSILGDDNFPITSESLDLAIDTTHRIDVMNPVVDVCKTVTMHSEEDSINCSAEGLLENSDLNLSVSNSLNATESILNVSESSLDGPRLNISSTQSVLNLLDPLGTDCLSFADGELNARSSQMSLDLQDLFPFHSS